MLRSAFQLFGWHLVWYALTDLKQKNGRSYCIICVSHYMHLVINPDVLVQTCSHLVPDSLQSCSKSKAAKIMSLGFPVDSWRLQTFSKENSHIENSKQDKIAGLFYFFHEKWYHFLWFGTIFEETQFRVSLVQFRQEQHKTETEHHTLNL